MIELTSADKCCGCMACEAICQMNAIEIKKDREGFAYPVILHEKCKSCGLCNKVCPENNIKETSVYEQKYYAAFNKDKDVVLRSSSGGIFSSVSEYVINQNGAVYGVYLDEAFEVSHGRVDKKNEIVKFCGSKYVQSSMRGIYEMVLNDLMMDKMVLFTGSPCQVSGILSFLKLKKVKLDNFFSIDFICHGVSSPKIWNEYVGYLEKKYDSKMISYTFRGKKQGWHNWYPNILVQKKSNNNMEDISELHRKKESYILMYQSLLFNRTSCFSCRYTSYDRVSDLTLGDFWNIKKIAPNMDDNTGTSEILVNSYKGESLLKSCENSLSILECSKKDVWQPHLEYPNGLPKGRNKFWKTYEESGIDKLMKKYGKGDSMTRIKNAVTPILKKTGLYVLFGKLYELIFVRKNKINND